MHAALPDLLGEAPLLSRLLAVQHARLHADRAGIFTPLRPRRNFSFVVTDIKQSAAPKAGFFAALDPELLPQVERLGCQRQLALIAVLLAAPAPVTAGLLAPDHALFDQRHLQSAFGQV